MDEQKERHYQKMIKIYQKMIKIYQDMAIRALLLGFAFGVIAVGAVVYILVGL